MIPDSPEWFYIVNGQRIGPVDAEALQSALESGRIGKGDLVWTAGMHEWRPAGEAIGLLDTAGDHRLDSQAVWSLALGLLSIFGLFVFIMLPAAIFGLILGIRARRSTKRGLAIAGIALSSIGLLFWIGLLVAFVAAISTMGWDQFVVEVLSGLQSIQ